MLPQSADSDALAFFFFLLRHSREGSVHNSCNMCIICTYCMSCAYFICNAYEISAPPHALSVSLSGGARKSLCELCEPYCELFFLLGERKKRTAPNQTRLGSHRSC